MSYIGSTPTSQNFTSGTDYFNGTGSQTVFTLTRSVNTVNDIEVVVNNVVQQPNTYTVSGTSLTLSAAPSSGTSNVYVRYISTNQQSFSVSNNSIGYNQLTTDMQSKFAMKNRLINGSMAIWQRGTSFTSLYSGGTAASYCADRWTGYRGGFVANLDVTRQNGFSGFQYCLRMQRTSGTTSTQSMVLSQVIETANCYDLAGKTVTVSAFIRAGSNYSGGGVGLTILTGTGTDQGFGSFANGTWTTQASQSSSVTITTTETLYSATFTVPVGTTEIAYAIGYTPTGTAGANDYIEFTGAQLEVGSSATGFEYRQYQQELALCQRYYETTTATPPTFGITNVQVQVVFLASYCTSPQWKVTKRATPTVVYYSRNGTAGQVSTTLTGLDASVATAVNISASGIWAINLSTTQTAYSNGMEAGFTASAEL